MVSLNDDRLNDLTEEVHEYVDTLLDDEYPGAYVDEVIVNVDSASGRLYLEVRTSLEETPD